MTKIRYEAEVNMTDPVDISSLRNTMNDTAPINLRNWKWDRVLKVGLRM
jgi:hypothetical protein